jgi:hypothetical protein
MKNLCVVLWNYIREVFFSHALNITLSCVDVLLILPLIIPKIAIGFSLDTDSYRTAIFSIFFMSFLIANIVVYKRYYEKIFLFNDDSIIIEYFQSKNEYAEIVNTSDETLTDISATVTYIDKSSKEIFSQEKKFFKQLRSGVWDEGHSITVLGRNEKIFLELPSLWKLSVSNVIVEFQFKIVKSSVNKTIRKEIQIQPNDSNWLIS